MTLTTVPRMTEEDLLFAVLKLAKMYGWRSFHVRPAQTNRGWRTAVQGDGKGFPDLVLLSIERRRAIAAELKSETGSLTPDQKEWLWAFENASDLETFVWRPSDLEAIAEILK